MKLNKECETLFGISTWPRWDYELDKGTLVFSKAGIPRVVASIQAVGTTSRASGTWTWAWANKSLPAAVQKHAHEVRQFGLNEGVNQLAEACLTDDEYLGWGMTAVMAKIASARGAYRCPDENGFLYVVYTDIAFADSPKTVPAADTSAEDRLECNIHGSGNTAYICEHLAANPDQAWHSDSPSDDNPWPDAWCAVCDKAYQQYGEWNDSNSDPLKVRLICHHCYESLRASGYRVCDTKVNAGPIVSEPRAQASGVCADPGAPLPRGRGSEPCVGVRSDR